MHFKCAEMENECQDRHMSLHAMNRQVLPVDARDTVSILLKVSVTYEKCSES